MEQGGFVKRVNKTKTVLVCLFLCSVGATQNLAELADMAQEHIRDRIEAAGIPPKIDIGEEHIYASVVLPQFYEDRIYMPAWIGSGYQELRHANTLGGGGRLYRGPGRQRDQSHIKNPRVRAYIG